MGFNQGISTGGGRFHPRQSFYPPSYYGHNVGAAPGPGMGQGGMQQTDAYGAGSNAYYPQVSRGSIRRAVSRYHFLFISHQLYLRQCTNR